ncbi:MAG: efflux RND transporter periplasmic adaptor subunit, partial [Bacteroidota bacterium]
MGKNAWIVLSSILFGGSCSDAPVQNEKDTVASVVNTIELTTEQMAGLGIQYGDVQQERMRSIIKVFGKIDLPPQNIISVNFPLGGFLKSTKLIPGMRIKKGEVLAIMEDQSIVQLQQDYLSNTIRLHQAQQEYSRQKNLSAENAGTVKSLQNAESEMKVLSYSVKGLEERLKLIGINVDVLNEQTISGRVEIKSTINGYVSKVFVNTGKYVQPTETLFELIDPEEIHAALTIFEKDLPYIRAGKEVEIRLIDDPAKVYSGDVILVDREVGDDRTATAHCHFDNRPAQLLPGMLVSAEITLENQSARITSPEYTFAGSSISRIS